MVKEGEGREREEGRKEGGRRRKEGGPCGG